MSPVKHACVTYASQVTFAALGYSSLSLWICQQWPLRMSYGRADDGSQATVLPKDGHCSNS